MENPRSRRTHDPISFISVQTTITGNSEKKRKDGGGGGLLSGLKFWRRKDKKTTRSLPAISQPSKFKHIGGASDHLVGATLEERYQKSRSLPQGVTRRSALGSHSPFGGVNDDNVVVVPLEKQADSDIELNPLRRTLQRRATLPKLVSAHQQQHWDVEERQSILDDGQILDPADIGVAITSGANFLKRRSRSANALYATASTSAEQSSIPVSWRDARRRSDEIRYWRASVCPNPQKYIHLEPSVQHYAEIQAVKKEAAEDESTPENVEKIHNDPPISEKDFANRGTFDFGGFANAIHQQENIPLEQRVMTMEVKLMDLEYAICKLQPSTTQPTAEPVYTSPSQSSHLHSDAATSTSITSTSTQPTSSSMMNSSPPHDPCTPIKPQNPTTRSHTQQPQPQAEGERESLITLPTSHLTTLLSLIRREQSARHRLEDQIVQLQRDLKILRSQILPRLITTDPSSTTTPARRANGATAADVIGGVGGYGLEDELETDTESEPESETETEDGFTDVYETPLERARAALYAGHTGYSNGHGGFAEGGVF